MKFISKLLLPRVKFLLIVTILMVIFRQVVTHQCDNQPDVDNFEIPRFQSEYDTDPEFCRGTRVNEVCNFCCLPGLRPSEPLTCAYVNRTTGIQTKWVPDRISCDPDRRRPRNNDDNPEPTGCGSFSYGQTPFMRKKEDNLFFLTFFSTQNRIPLLSIAEITERNFFSGIQPRIRPEFKIYPCGTVINHQLNRQYYRDNLDGYDIGHFQRYADFRFSAEAEAANMNFVNSAPQDSWMNRVTWRVLEKNIRLNFEELNRRHPNMYKYYVMTVVNSPPGYVRSPKTTFFSKIVCLSPVNNDDATVFAFYATNTPVINRSEEGMKRSQIRRMKDVFHVRSKFEVEKKLGISRRVWNDVIEHYGGDSIPFLRKCSRARSLDSLRALENFNLLFGKLTDVNEAIRNWNRELPLEEQHLEITPADYESFNKDPRDHRIAAN